MIGQPVQIFRPESGIGKPCAGIIVGDGEVLAFNDDASGLPAVTRLMDVRQCITLKDVREVLADNSVAWMDLPTPMLPKQPKEPAIPDRQQTPDVDPGEQEMSGASDGVPLGTAPKPARGTRNKPK